MDRSLNRLSIFLFFADIFLVLLGLFIAIRLRIYLPFGGSFQIVHAQLPDIVYVFVILAWSISLISAKAYHPQKVLRAVDEIRRILISSVQAALLLAGTLYLTYRDVSRFEFIYMYFSITFLILLYRGLIRIYFRYFGNKHKVDTRRILVVGAGELGCKIAEVVLQRSRWGLDLVGFLDDDPKKMKWQPENAEGRSVLGEVDQLVDIVKELGINEVFFALPASAYKRLSNTVATLQNQAIKINIVPDYFSLALIHAQPSVFGGLPVIGLRDAVIGGMPRLIKRVFDEVVSFLLLLFLWPIMLLIALWIRLETPGPAIFKQKRVGENGQLFKMYKFRTMVRDAENRKDEVIHTDQDGNIIHKHLDDPRVTRLGRFLRRTSLDELPQLVNVLKGDMSLVGPRPELPWLVKKYEPWQRKRFAVPQGITGWWQVNKRSEGLMHLSTEDDLYYVYNYSLWLDIKILFMTIGALFRGY